MIELKNNPAGNFFLLAGPCVIEGRRNGNAHCRTYRDHHRKTANPIRIQRGSYRKANRSRLDSFMGIGDEKGAEDTAKGTRHFRSTYRDRHSCRRRSHHGCRICGYSANSAFLCRQTDLLVAAAKTGKTINIKKGQFLSPLAMRFAADKVVEAGNRNVMLTERGTTFGYQDLVIDYRGIPEMQTFGFPVILDVTHSLQQPNQTSGVTGGMPQLYRDRSQSRCCRRCRRTVHRNPRKSRRSQE